jgi:hypothetical protein
MPQLSGNEPILGLNIDILWGRPFHDRPDLVMIYCYPFLGQNMSQVVYFLLKEVTLAEFSIELMLS